MTKAELLLALETVDSPDAEVHLAVFEDEETAAFRFVNLADAVKLGPSLVLCERGLEAEVARISQDARRQALAGTSRPKDTGIRKGD
jgi:hypothetical protein